MLPTLCEGVGVMPKSRGRKRVKTAPAGPVKMDSQMLDAMHAQRAAFVAKFGREPGPSDPIFFDPDKDVPTRMSAAKMHADVAEAMRKAGIDEAKIKALLKELK